MFHKDYDCKGSIAPTPEEEEEGSLVISHKRLGSKTPVVK
jgi:hypothetical protein